jgi:hypothetical protein
MSQYPVLCLYCDKRTGLASERGRRVVCYGCAWRRDRDEAREIAAGMKPWARPLSFWVGFFGWRPVRMDVGREEGNHEANRRHR